MAVAGPPRVVLIHGAATTGRVWRHVVPLLDGFDVHCPDRPCSGDLAIEVTALTADCRGAVVAGVSGGATLGLALAAAGVPMAAALLHEAGRRIPGPWTARSVPRRLRRGRGGGLRRRPLRPRLDPG